MERELEALAAGPAGPFAALVAAAGGRGQVLLVGELWAREPSRAQLRDFARALFPPDAAAGEPGAAAAASSAPRGAHGRGGPRGAGRALAAPLVFALCRAASLAAPEPRRRLREMLRDVRGRRRPGAALVAVLVAEPAPAPAAEEDAAAAGLARLEALLRAVFGRQAGGPVQAAVYRPGHPGARLAVQAAACRALRAAGARAASGRSLGETRPPLTAGLLFLGSLEPEEGPGCHLPSVPAQDTFQDPEEALALTAIFPNGDCEDPEKGSRACDGVAHPPAEPPGASR